MILCTICVIIKLAAQYKGEWLFILSELNSLKLIKNLAKLFLILIILLTIFIYTKYQPAYAVTLNNEFIGYVQNKDNFNSKIENEILNSSEENVAFVALDNVDYKYEFVNTKIIDENSVFETLKENSKNIYKVYEISNGDEDDAVYVKTEEEAQEIVNNLKSQYNKVTDNLAITSLYLEEEISDDAIKEAKDKMNEKLKEKQEEQEKIETRTVNGIYLAVLPVTGGTISSRYGSNESIRNHTHKGLDIAASYGTPIKAVADGKVIFSGTESGYGNLIILDHGNSVTTYYGHCSKLLVQNGAEVKAGDIIAKVGSTGNSTGNHLHFEIRIDGSYVNPQKYIYN